MSQGKRTICHIIFALSLLVFANSHSAWSGTIADDVQEVICSEDERLSDGGDLCELMDQELDMLERLDPFIPIDKSVVGKNYLNHFLKGSIRRLKRDVKSQNYSWHHFVDKILHHFDIDYVIATGITSFTGDMRFLLRHKIHPSVMSYVMLQTSS